MQKSQFFSKVDKIPFVVLSHKYYKVIVNNIFKLFYLHCRFNQDGDDTTEAKIPDHRPLQRDLSKPARPCSPARVKKVVDL